MYARAVPFSFIVWVQWCQFYGRPLHSHTEQVGPSTPGRIALENVCARLYP